MRIKQFTDLTNRCLERHALTKAWFCMDHRNKNLNERQRKAANLLLDAGPNGFEGGMSTKKYESITGTSRASASRELIEREAPGLLGGRVPAPRPATA